MFCYNMQSKQWDEKAFRSSELGSLRGRKKTVSNMEKEAGLEPQPKGKSAGELIVLYERKEGNWITDQRLEEEITQTCFSESLS